MYLDKEIIAIVPARGGSKGVKDKNIRLLDGMPLIGWTILEAQKSKYIDKIIVSTDSEKIKKVAKDYEAEVIDRPDELATDTASTVDVIIDLLHHFKGDNSKKHILILQCTSPFRTSNHIDEAIEKYFSSKEAESLISIRESEYPPFWIKEKKGDYIEDFINNENVSFTRRQDCPKTYQLNGAIYITSFDSFIINQGFDSLKTAYYEMDTISSIDIDTEIDFSFAEFCVEKNIIKKYAY